jgi:DNA invertase Pin-like site-specific DNA recombinase
MLVGYGRTSTSDQIAGLDDQIAKLEAAGCEEIFKEHASGAKQRDELDKALRHVRKGDTLVVTKMDRLARDLRALLEVVNDLDERGVALRILDFNGDTVDTKSATGRLMLQMFGAFAEFERTMMLERQRIGIEDAKARGVYSGRKPKAMNQREQIIALADSGMTRSGIAARLGISERSVYRALRAEMLG